MLQLTLRRYFGSDKVTLGVLCDAVGVICGTIECPWLDNRRNESCIPVGSYICRRVKSPRFGETFEVTDVPGRSLIRFHRGNAVADSRGCPLLVSYVFGDTGFGSRIAVARFMKRLAGVQSFRLFIS